MKSGAPKTTALESGCRGAADAGAGAEPSGEQTRVIGLVRPVPPLPARALPSTAHDAPLPAGATESEGRRADIPGRTARNAGKEERKNAAAYEQLLID